MKTHQQTKPLECETSLVNLKELVEKKGEVAEKVQRNCKVFVVLDVYQVFPVPYNWYL